jgi:hypothetical protein
MGYLKVDRIPKIFLGYLNVNGYRYLKVDGIPKLQYIQKVDIQNKLITE